jgi:hypothetical protein
MNFNRLPQAVGQKLKQIEGVEDTAPRQNGNW